MAMCTIPPCHDFPARGAALAASLRHHCVCPSRPAQLLLIFSYSYDRSRKLHRGQGKAAIPAALARRAARVRQRVALGQVAGTERSAARRGPAPCAQRGVMARPVAPGGFAPRPRRAQLHVLVEAARQRNCHTFVIVPGKNYKSPVDSRPRGPARERSRQRYQWGSAWSQRAARGALAQASKLRTSAAFALFYRPRRHAMITLRDNPCRWPSVGRERSVAA
jgi:hypothetical protein